MEEQKYKNESKTKMMKSLKALESEFSMLRTGRANPNLLDKIQVDYYGSPTPLKQVATVSVPEARQLLVQAFDKNILGDIEKAIQASDLGVNPNNDGKNIRIVIPPLTGDRRKDLVKHAKAMGEKARIAVRNIRRDMKQQVKKDSELSEDDRKHIEHEIQNITDSIIKDIDKLLQSKEQEILEV